MHSNRSDFENYSKEELIETVKLLQKENELLKKQLFGHKSRKTKSKRSSNKFDFSNVSFRHVLLQICYLGWDHDGFTIQDNTINTVEFYLFEALKKTCLIESRDKSNYHRCGRTDKGVSAFSQFISIDLRSKSQNCHPNDDLDFCKMLNSVLPKTIRCIRWLPVPPDFSARFDCQVRTYKYFFNKANMDIELMQSAVKDLIGTHDFRNFCKMDVTNGVVEFTRTIVDAKINKCFTNDVFMKDKSDYYDMYVLTIEGFAYLWHQIRCIMAVLILVGQKQEKPSIIKNLLAVSENPRKPIYNIALNVPLNLFHVSYDVTNAWIFSKEDLKFTMKFIREFWFESTAKSTMLRYILSELEKMSIENHINYSIPNDYMFTGIHSKEYQPLLERRKCGKLIAIPSIQLGDKD